MALSVMFRAPSPVKVAHVTYRMEHAWNVKTGYMEATVTYHVPPTVRTTHVTYRMENVLYVNLDGLGCIVEQVRITIIIFWRAFMLIT